jgi:hypothetical protein
LDGYINAEPAACYNRIELVEGVDPSYVLPSMNAGFWDPLVDPLGWLLAHEAGHLLGLYDRYDASGQTLPGFENNIMFFDYLGDPWEQDIEDIINRWGGGEECGCY